MECILSCIKHKRCGFIPRKARREGPLFNKMYRKGALVILIHSNHQIAINYSQEGIKMKTKT
jgi:hypothetical protein